MKTLAVLHEIVKIDHWWTKCYLIYFIMVVRTRTVLYKIEANIYCIIDELDQLAL